jgi:ATP-dependent exoDNAse (exonuclease V) alpha subunit
MHRAIARNNGERIIADPSNGLDAITQQQSTFTRRDMAMFAHRHSFGTDQFHEVMGATRSAPDLVERSKDTRGEDRLITRQTIAAEQRLNHAAGLMAERQRHEVNDRQREDWQREDWQRAATRDLATGSTGDAIHAYDSHGMVHEAETRAAARQDLIERWDRDRQAAPHRSRIILTNTNDEVRELNEAARARMGAAGNLGDDLCLWAERGARSFASGDCIMFLQNDRSLGVVSGTLGAIDGVNIQSMIVRTHYGRSVAFDLKHYDRIDHGYAVTIHKAQGMTGDRT